MKTKSAVTIHAAPGLPFAPRIERIDNPPARPTFRTVYGAEVCHFTDDLDAFEEHGRNMRHAAECAGLLDKWGDTMKTKTTPFIPSDDLDTVTNDFGTGWDEESREFLLCQFIADHCDPEAFRNYLEAQARAEIEEAEAMDGYDQ